MLKVTNLVLKNLSILLTITTAIVVNHQAPAEAGGKIAVFCNKTDTTAAVVIARRYTNLTDKGYTEMDVRGWWKMNPGECKNIGVTDLNYFYAHNDAGRVWAGEQPFCVHRTKFQWGQYIGGQLDSSQNDCPSNMDRLGFRPLIVNSSRRIINLN